MPKYDWHIWKATHDNPPYAIRDEYGEWIAPVVDDWEHAQLIAAAPLLLEACQALTDLIVTMTTRPDITVTQAEIGARLDQAQAAIEAAGGDDERAEAR